MSGEEEKTVRKGPLPKIKGRKTRVPNLKPRDSIIKNSHKESTKKKEAGPDFPKGNVEELARAANSVKSRCKYIANDESRAGVIEKFLQFTRWVNQEQIENAGKAS